MTDYSLALLFLGLMSVCLLVMTITMVATARRLRETLRRVNAVLPQAEQVLHEVHRSLRQARQMLIRMNGASHHMEAMAQQASGIFEGVLERFALWRRRAQAFFKEYVGNGAGADPRRHHRSR